MALALFPPPTNGVGVAVVAMFLTWTGTGGADAADLPAALPVERAPARIAETTRARSSEPPLWTTVPAGKHARPSSFADLAARAMPAVVHVRGLAPPEPGTPPGKADVDRYSIGTGFVIERDGYIVTNEHVIRDVTDLRIRLYDGREFSACVVGDDPPTDIALLKVSPPAPLPVLPLADRTRFASANRSSR